MHDAAAALSSDSSRRFKAWVAFVGSLPTYCNGFDPTSALKLDCSTKSVMREGCGSGLGMYKQGRLRKIELCPVGATLIFKTTYWRNQCVIQMGKEHSEEVKREAQG